GLGDPRSQRTAGQETTARTSLYKTNVSPVLDGRAVEKSRENRSSGSHQRPRGDGRHGCQRGLDPRCRRCVFRPAGFHRSNRQRLFGEHDLGESWGSAVGAARRAGYQWPEKLGPRLVEKSRDNWSSGGRQRWEVGRGHPLPGTQETWAALSVAAFAIRHPAFAICHPPSAICHSPTAIRHPPSAICHPPFAISPSPFRIPHLPEDERRATVGRGEIVFLVFLLGATVDVAPPPL